MKISEITLENVASFLRIDTPEQGSAEEIELEAILSAAKEYVSSYTGIPQTSETEGAETLDSFESFSVAVLALCSDMYDNRTMQIEKNNINKVISSILDMHRRNFV